MSDPQHEGSGRQPSAPQAPPGTTRAYGGVSWPASAIPGPAAPARAIDESFPSDEPDAPYAVRGRRVQADDEAGVDVGRTGDAAWQPTAGSQADPYRVGSAEEPASAAPWPGASAPATPSWGGSIISAPAGSRDPAESRAVDDDPSATLARLMRGTRERVLEGDEPEIPDHLRWGVRRVEAEVAPEPPASDPGPGPATPPPSDPPLPRWQPPEPDAWSTARPGGYPDASPDVPTVEPVEPDPVRERAPEASEAAAAPQPVGAWPSWQPDAVAPPAPRDGRDDPVDHGPFGGVSYDSSYGPPAHDEPTAWAPDEPAETRWGPGPTGGTGWGAYGEPAAEARLDGSWEVAAPSAPDPSWTLPAPEPTYEPEPTQPAWQPDPSPWAPPPADPADEHRRDDQAPVPGEPSWGGQTQPSPPAAPWSPAPPVADPGWGSASAPVSPWRDPAAGTLAASTQSPRWGEAPPAPAGPPGEDRSWGHAGAEQRTSEPATYDTGRFDQAAYGHGTYDPPGGQVGPGPAQAVGAAESPWAPPPAPGLASPSAASYGPAPAGFAADDTGGMHVIAAHDGTPTAPPPAYPDWAPDEERTTLAQPAGAATVIPLPWTRAYVVGLAVLTVLSVVLVGALVVAVGHGTAWPALWFIPHAILLAVVWFQVLRPVTVTIDEQRFAVRRPFTGTRTYAWTDLDAFDVRPVGKGDLVSGPVGVWWSIHGKGGQVVANAAEAPRLLAALRRHVPHRLTGL